MSNAAQAHIKRDLNRTYSEDDLRRDLDNFCKGLWDFRLSQFLTEDMVGDEKPAPISYFLLPYIMRHGGTIIFSPPGRGKSYTALIWAVSIDAGCSKFWKVTKGRVLFINLERSRESVRRRLSAVNRVLELPPTRPLLFLNARGKSLIDVLPACRKAVKEKGVEVVVLDSISRAGLGDLNENQSGNRIVDALSSLCPTWLALGHTSRQNEEHMYGSVMQDAGADICVQLCSQITNEGILGCGLQITKQNDSGITKQTIHALTFDESGLTEFRPARTFEFPEIEGKGRTDMETTVTEWLANQDSGDATATQVSDALGYPRANISKLFNKSPKFVHTRTDKRNVFYGVKRNDV